MSETADRPIARKILRATQALIKDQGGLDFSMRQVAAEAGMSLRTLYEHFESKDDLVFAIYRDSMRAMADEVVPMVELCRSPEEKLRILVTLAVVKSRGKTAPVALMRERDYLASMRPAAVREVLEPLRRLVLDILDMAPRSGNDDARRELVADIVLTTLMAHYHSFANGMINATAQELTDGLWRCIARGMGFRIVDEAK